MKTILKQAAALLLALTAVGASADTAPTLKIGSPAPKLQNGKYVQGDPVKAFEPGKAYIVEFWATWCGPCRASIPHLNKIYTKYKDKGLVVIGQDCWEEDDAKVAPFVKDMGDKMTYRVALDDKTKNEKGAMADTWMTAAGQGGIPTAFLVDTNGIIAWIGHPMELEEKQDVIDQVLAGKYDVKKAAADHDKEVKEEAETEKQMEPMQEKLAAMSKAAQAKKWDEALDDLTAAEKLIPEKKGGEMKINFEVTRFRLLLAKKDFPAAYKLAGKLGDDNKDNGYLLNFLATQIVTDKSIEKPDLDLAEKLINRANDGAEGKDAEILDTQARVLFMKGKKDAAVAAETKALSVAEAADKPALQKSLDSYKKGELPAED
jgi:thiol-disulfide isomerase/thioredoxin